jgi:hypothetical protein
MSEQIEGLHRKTNNSNVVYLHVFDYCLCQKMTAKKFEELDEEAQKNWEGPIKTTNPQTGEPVQTYVMRYDSVVARIVDINKYEKTFTNGNKQTGFNVTLMAGSTKVVWQLKWIEPALKRLLKVLPNIDLDRPVRISAFKGMKNNAPKLALSFRQGTDTNIDNWDKVNEFWNQQNLPTPVQDPMDNKWDYNEQNKFLGLKFRDEMLPKIKAIAERLGVTAPVEYNPAEPHEDEMVDDEDSPSSQQFNQLSATPPQAPAQQQPPVVNVPPATEVLSFAPPSDLAQARQTYNEQLKGSASAPQGFVPPAGASPYAPAETAPLAPAPTTAPKDDDIPF